MITVNYKLKDFFFDRLAVKRDVEKKSLKFLGRAGGFIRQVARRSMRSAGKKGKSSDPGTPPRYHSKDKVATLRNILYGYDPSRQSVIVGPVGLNQKQYLNGNLLKGTVPQLHEFGGIAGVREKQITTVVGKTGAGRGAGGRFTKGSNIYGKKWVPIGRRKPRAGQPIRVRNANYPARPYMAPALEKAKAKFPQLWYGSSAGGNAA